MKFIQKLIPSIPKTFTQSGNNRNRTALRGLRDIGFGMPEIRSALFRLNGVTLRSLSNGISPSALHSTLTGKRANPKAMEILAQAVDIPVEEMFPADR